MRPRIVSAGFTSLILAFAAVSTVPAVAQNGVHVSGGFSGTHVSAPHVAAPVAHAPAIGGAPRIAPRSNAYSYSPAAHSGAHAADEGYWTSSGFIPTHSGHGHSGDGNHHRVGYGHGVVGYPVFSYGYGGLGYLNGGLDLDDNDPNDPNNAPIAQGGDGYNGYVDNAPGPRPEAGYPQTAYEAANDTARIPYMPSGMNGGYPASGNASRSDGLGHPKVTLIFKDGRPPIQIQNYAMTQTKVFVRDEGMERDISINDLDVAATRAANDQAGVDFELPASR
jgi:hypothetical protein